MKKFTLIATFLLVSIGIIYNSCKKDNSVNLQNLIRIVVTPADTVIAVGQTIQYKATGYFLDSTHRDVTGNVQWITNPTGKVTITSGGIATTIDTGATYVVAGAWGVVGGATILNTTANGVARARMLKDYTDNYLGSDLNDCLWTGNTVNCDPGGVSVISHQKVLQRINYFRRLCGLNYDITLDNVKGAKCQKAALMFKANNALNHYPPPTWTCFTSDGLDAARNSNIALGMHSVNAVTAFMEDPDTNNKPVGHRRWLLSSCAKIMAHGSTDISCAIWVTQNDTTPWAHYPEFVAYPPKGYVPQPLIFPRWSFSIPKADFTTATVTMKDGVNANVALQVISNNNIQFGDKTIVWEPSGINNTANKDVTSSVTVSNVMISGVAKSYTYTVTIVKPGTKKSNYEIFKASHPDIVIK